MVSTWDTNLTQSLWSQRCCGVPVDISGPLLIAPEFLCNKIRPRRFSCILVKSSFLRNVEWHHFGSRPGNFDFDLGLRHLSDFKARKLLGKFSLVLTHHSYILQHVCRLVGVVDRPVIFQFFPPSCSKFEFLQISPRFQSVIWPSWKYMYSLNMYIDFNRWAPSCLALLSTYFHLERLVADC